MSSYQNLQSSSRLKSLDGLRGIAAMGVVLYHLCGNLKAELAQAFPAFLNTLVSYGYLGVPIFFVISGFRIQKYSKTITSITKMS